MLPVFGPGALFLQNTSLSGPQTSINIGKVNEFSLDQSFTKKELYGQNQLPLFVARGTAKFTAKAKAALISGIALNAAFYGLTFSAGQQATALSESHTVSTGTVSVSNGTSFVSDLGVTYASTGLPATLATAAPSEGSYEVSSLGVYTFNTSDNGKGVFVTYTYAATGGQQMEISSQLIGYTPTFQLWYYTMTNGVPLNLQLYNCVADKNNWQFKLEDFMMPELDFSVFANAANNVGLVSFGEIS